MKIFLDDKRQPSNCARYMRDNIYRVDQDWAVVKSFVQFLYVVSLNIERIEVISFDYELKSNEKNGLECAQWLIEYYKLEGRKLPQILIHSEHPEGKKALEKLFNGRAR